MGMRYRDGSTPLAVGNGERKPRQHALSFEGAGRFWRPSDTQDSTWNLLRRKGNKVRALSSPRPRDKTSSLHSNIGQWLDSQSDSYLVEQADENDDSKQANDRSPPASSEKPTSVSLNGSDSVSVRTLSSTTSVTNGASSSRFKSLAEQIADDERRENAKQHLKRIMEAEEARVAQSEPFTEKDLEAGIRLEAELGSDGNRTLNALRLTFEPSQEGWSINDFLSTIARSSTTESLPDYETSNKLHRKSISPTLPRKESEEDSSVHTVTASDPKDQSISTSSVSQPLQPEEGESPTALITASATLKGEEASPPLPPNDASAAQSPTFSEDTSLATSTFPALALPQEYSSFPTVTDTLFQDLNRLKMSPSIRQGPFVRPPLPIENQTETATNVLRDTERKLYPSQSVPGLASVFATVSPPYSRPPTSRPVFKEVVTPPIPSNVVELSTSPSVLYREKTPKVHEKYRRARQHADPSVYNTLPNEPYPLLPPEPTFEAPPQEDDLRDLTRSESPRKPAETPSPKPVDRPMSIEPDIDPRTGLPWLIRGP